MSRFGELFREARRRAGLTQKELGKNVDVSDAYICKLERGVFPPPSREVTLKLADVLRLRDKAKFAFLLAANAVSTEDVERLTPVVDGRGQQPSAIPHPTLVHAAHAIPEELFRTTGEEIDHLIAAAGLTDEDEERVATMVVEFTKGLLAFIEPQRKKRKEG